MVSRKDYSFLNFILFCLLLPKNILISAADNCLNPTFGKDQKIVVDYFFTGETKSLSKDLCTIVLGSNGLITPSYHVCSDLKNKAHCVEDDNCLNDRVLACYLKYYADSLNDCTKEYLPRANPLLADCTCAGSADNILISNEKARINYGIKTLPALVLNKKYDPCFKDYSLDGMKAYFCKAFKNALPVCQS